MEFSALQMAPGVGSTWVHSEYNILDILERIEACSGGQMPWACPDGWREQAGESHAAKEGAQDGTKEEMYDKRSKRIGY